MTHRERVLTALRHEEPDRVPMDLGGCLASTIVASCYPALRRELGLPDLGTRESLRYASLAVIDADVRTALDLDLAAYPVGMCSRTLFAKAEIVLWRTGENVFHIEVWRSFADYLWRYLVQAGVEFA